jgi:ParB family chromosome partitioning protein
MTEETAKPKKKIERGLGRGLDALFGDEEADFLDDSNEVEAPSSVPKRTVGIGQLVPCADQPRRHFDEEALKELAKSIETYGLLQPILVRPKFDEEGVFEIVAGERRWRASQLAQLHEIPIVVREMDDKEMFQIALVENLQREDLNPIEEALGYDRLIEEFGYKPREVAEVLGKSRSNIANMTRLLALPNSVQVMVEVGDISIGHARALLGSEAAEVLAMKVVEGNLTVRDTENLVADYEGKIKQEKYNLKPKAERKGFSAKDADTLALEKEVSDQIGMNVAINMKDEHKGEMKIDFKSLDQLDEILQRLAQTPKR